jgi:hypothetical protein
MIIMLTFSSCVFISIDDDGGDVCSTSSVRGISYVLTIDTGGTGSLDGNS